MANDTKIEKRVAKLFGRSAYRDIRDGFGGNGVDHETLSDQDIAAALGWVVSKQGRIASQVLETFYGSTLMHAPDLRRAWEGRERQKGDARDQVVMTRFAGELAIRELAGARFTSTCYAEYSYLLFSRRETLQQRVQDARFWLNDLRNEAVRELVDVMRSSSFRDERRNTRKNVAAA